MFDHNYIRKRGNVALNENFIITAGFCWDVMLENRFKNSLYLEPFGYKVYSQNDEDGIIHEIFKRIGYTDKRFIEFGVQDGLESNTHCLLYDDWRGLWIEGEERYCNFINQKFHSVIQSGQLKILNSYVTKNNINQLFEKAGFTEEIDLLSIDIDGNDYHVWKALKCLSPRVVVIEYNAKFPSYLEWIMPYNEHYIWRGTDRHGASLKAYEKLGEQLGYVLVGTNISGANAFFVRRDLVEHKFVEPATAEMLYNPVRYKYLKFVSGHPPKTCLRYSGEGMAGDFDISGENFILHNGFYKPEYDANGRFNLQWMRGTKCETFVRSLVDMPKKIKISFINEIEELEITVCVEGEEKQKFIGIKKGEQDIFSVIEHDYTSGDILKVDIEINKLWNHHQVDGTDDTMPLGIAVINIEVLQ